MSTAEPRTGGTIADLRGENQDLLRRQAGASPADGASIERFLDRIAAYGARIDNARERRAAQAMLNFWSAELIARGEKDADWVAPTLATAVAPERPAEAGSLSAAPEPPRPAPRPRSPAFGQVLSASPAEGVAGPLGQMLDLAASLADSPRIPDLPPAAPADGKAALQRARKLVQISAAARRWKESNDAGWLLSGRALRDAEAFANEDDDIGELVRASRANARQTRLYRVALAVSVFALVLALIDIASAYRNLDAAYLRLDAAQRELEQNSAARASLTESLKQEIDRNAQLAQERREDAQRQQAVDRERQLQLDRLQSLLREVAPIVRAARDDGTLAAIPPGLRTYLDDTPVRLPPLPEGVPLRGYDPDFLNGGPIAKTRAPTMPMPRPGGTEEAAAIPYLNYSLAMDETRRLARVAAVNIRRSGLVALQSVNAVLQVDPRLSPEQQPKPQWFDAGLVAGRLVDARAIAWGEGFPADAVAAGRRASAMVAAATNAVPQFEAFERGPWTQAETYAREAFAPGADRIVVFSGPVLRPDDPRSASGTQIPRSFWKVMIAADPDDPSTPRVEAYLLSQYGAEGGPVASGTRFDRDAAAVPLARIGAMTGLNFGPLLRAADKAPFIVVAGRPGIAAVLADLDAVGGLDTDTRRAATQRALNAIRAPLAPDDRRRLATALVARASDASFKALSPQARVNVATLIAAVPKEWWDTLGWIDLKAAARRAVADAVETLGGCASGEACAQLAVAKQRLDWDVATNRIVYVQFAGMVRDDVKAMSARLRLLGWTLPGEERTPLAAGLNVVRFAPTPDDQSAAELLAADYRALGQSAVKAVQDREVKRGITEAWISR